MSVYDLKKTVAAVKAQRVPFGFYLGSKTNSLVVSASVATVVKEIEKEAGGALKMSFRGVCFRDGEILVFATKSAPTDMRKMLIDKALKAEKVANTSNFELRQLGADESDGFDGGSLSVGGGSATTASPDPEKPKPLSLSVQWRVAREAAIAGVGEFIGKLRATGDEEAIQASAVVQQLAAQFPANLDMVIASFERAVASSDAGAIAAARAEMKSQATACLGYLKSNQKLIGICETNPFGAPVAISQPLMKVLASIAAQLK